jgi:hypothetical protein
VVFGTLLGPETTGPGFPGAGLFPVSWLHRSCAFSGPCGAGVWGVRYGVVV